MIHPTDIRPVRLAPSDVLRLGLLGLRTRRMRAALSALGISIGIATLVLVTGIPASSQKHLDEQLSALGTNMLRAQPQADQKPPVLLPEQAHRMAARIRPVTEASAVANTHALVRRSDRTDPNDGLGLNVLAARTNLLPAVSGTVRSGRFLDASTSSFPTAVLGYQAAARLGIPRLVHGRQPPQVLIDDRWFTVVGILDRMPLAPELDRSVLVGWQAAKSALGFDGHPTVIYVKAEEDSIEDVSAVLPDTLYPQLPGLVQVSRPSDALLAKRATRTTFSALFLGLAGVALLVGGIGVANTMYISVLERRTEIGLRRALGAGRGQIRAQFLTESVVLSTLGGVTGTVLGVLATLGYATYQGWPTVIPLPALALGTASTVLIGMVAGVYPSIRASRLPPTEALAAA
ncbi:ABC transporter permease [Streptomyces iranensis]|uniref:ABC transport system permease protein n=1 Tax=Streptomyces iranensis TaxID=576784 RepID=A0A060ZKD6_9ACTN|nr:ABC transporter permease [Streptomyces iranensis]MBP2066379.1 putative ABC transport system permease protein [Streptomyces iranensis]CDR02794.1 ABC transporter related protein [Streptomyces iranensis]